MKVSVALCTFNGEKYLQEQLDSILSQEIPVDEIVVCDDGSKDATISILNDYKNKFPDLIKIFCNKENLFFYKNFEKAINLCKEEVIILSDQDDVWEEDKTKETIAFFQKNPQFDGVFHDLKLIDGEEIKPSYLNWKSVSHETIIKDLHENNLFLTFMKNGSFALGCSLSIRNTALKKYKLQNFRTSHDFYIALKLSSNNKLGFIPKSLISYRLHPKQVYGLRYKSDNKNEVELSENEQYYKTFVWSYLKIIEKFRELNPEQNVKYTRFYTTFIQHRNLYLKKLPFVERKIFTAKCIKHNYLELKIQDFFKF